MWKWMSIQTGVEWRFAALVGLLAMWGLLAVGCSFDSGIEGAECDPDRDHSDAPSRKCEDGFWVRIDDPEPGDASGDTVVDGDGGETGSCSVESVWYRDEDGDEFGTETDTVSGCQPPPGYVGKNGDCDDADPDRNPGADERCNGRDDDCDGEIDEMLTRSCGNSDGVCEPGMETCNDGTWGDCMGGTEPADSERCDGADNDCDGETDENLERPCGTDEGICEKGTETCTDGEWGNCSGRTTPESNEQCDGKDRDCDGETDDGTCKGVGATCQNNWECASGNCVSSGGSSTCRQTIFVTAETVPGDFAATSDADTRCTEAAHDAGLGISNDWTAVVANTNGSGRSRATFDYPVYNTNGDLVAEKREDFWKDANPPSLQHPVMYDASGTMTPIDVWTSTKEGGDSRDYCESNDTAWNSASSDDEGSIGRSDQTDATWIDFQDEHTCDNVAALYCIQDP